MEGADGSSVHSILLGSTSHYLIQKASVPVMVARRRLKRPPRKNAHLAKHRARVSLAEAAGVERVTQRVDEEVAHMRDEIKAEEDRETARMKDQERLREGAEEEEERRMLAMEGTWRGGGISVRPGRGGGEGRGDGGDLEREGCDTGEGRARTDRL